MAADATKLESVNEMLTMAGSLRTNSLSATRADVIMAEQMLDQVDRSVQARGLAFQLAVQPDVFPNAL